MRALCSPLVVMRMWTILTLIAGLLVSTPCLGQKAQSDATTAEARARFNEGLKLADEGNHEAARLKFSQAWILLKSPGIVFNLARSEQLSGHPVEALEHYRAFDKLASDPKVPEQQKQRAQEYEAELTSQLGQIDIDAAPSAQIAIDGKVVEWIAHDDPIPVMPGSHEVTATHDGKTSSVTLECTAGTVSKASLREPPPPLAPPPPPATAPAPSAQEPRSSWSAGHIAGLAIAGGGAVAIGLGVYFHIDSTNADEKANKLVSGLPDPRSSCRDGVVDKPAQCSTIADSRDRQDRSAIVRNVLWIGGGAMLIGGAALFLLSGRSSAEKPHAWTLIPSVSPRSSELSIVGTF